MGWGADGVFQPPRGLGGGGVGRFASERVAGPGIVKLKSPSYFYLFTVPLVMRFGLELRPPPLSAILHLPQVLP